MCWIGLNKQLTVKEGEIVNVVKIVRMTNDKKFIPYFIKTGVITEYKQGKTYNSDIIKHHFGNLEYGIREGIHSYLAKKVIVFPFAYDGKEYNQSKKYNEYSVRIFEKRNDEIIKPLGRYIYDSTIYPNSDTSMHLALLIGHLPTDTKYYINDEGEIVSDALTVDAIRPFALEMRY